MPLNYQCHSANVEQWTDEENQFFHSTIPQYMMITGIGVLCDDSFEEFIWRIFDLQLMLFKTPKEKQEFIEKCRMFNLTTINQSTLSRYKYYQQKKSQKIKECNSEWARKVDSTKVAITLKNKIVKKQKV